MYLFSSELTTKLDAARCLTQECIEICHDIFIDTNNEDNTNINHWFDNVSIYIYIHTAATL